MFDISLFIMIHSLVLVTAAESDLMAISISSQHPMHCTVQDRTGQIPQIDIPQGAVHGTSRAERYIAWEHQDY